MNIQNFELNLNHYKDYAYPCPTLLTLSYFIEFN